YDANIKWEETVTYNVGLDFGFINGRINGSIDVYKKLTDDLLAVIPVPAGTNFTNNILTNVGSLENQGVELTLNLVPFDSQNFTWEIGGNVSYNKNEITKLTKIQDPDDVGVLVGGISGGVGNTVQVHTVGYPTNTFYVYQQIYDEDGKPIEGEYEDLNGDGIINPDDRYRYEKPAPDVFMGVYTNFAWKNWNAGAQMRGSFGNYMYNNVNSQYAFYSNINGSKNYMANLPESYFSSEFVNPQFLSDFYVENASYFRLDNISLGYNFKNIINGSTSLKITAIVQNVFVISDYSGLDPEVSGGIDNNIYPRPRIFSVNVSLNL
ncbi:MAG TPA: TonB-dependent receptor, partial [Chitinophagales bacterium]|nr:TonB-dependent receptor [Chitinophagales bacterium]